MGVVSRPAFTVVPPTVLTCVRSVLTVFDTLLPRTGMMWYVCARGLHTQLIFSLCSFDHVGSVSAVAHDFV